MPESQHQINSGARFCEHIANRSAKIVCRGADREFGHHVADQEQAKRFYVSGRVQGVGYRFFARRIADQLGLSGYVKNLRDGRVEVYAVGIATQLQALQAELRHGPSYALVEGIDEQDAEIMRQWSQRFSIEDD